MAEAKKQRGKNAHWKLLNWALFVPSAHNSQVHDDSSINAGWLAGRSIDDWPGCTPQSLSALGRNELQDSSSWSPSSPATSSSLTKSVFNNCPCC